MTFIVMKGQSIPCEKKNQFEFNSNEFKDKKIKFYQGENNFSKNNKLLIELPLDFKKSKKKTFNIIVNVTESHELKVKIDEQEQKYNLELDEITEIDEKVEIINNLENDIEKKNQEIENKNKEIENQRKEIEKKNKEIENQRKEIENKNKEIEDQRKEISELNKKVDELNKELRAMRISNDKNNQKQQNDIRELKREFERMQNKNDQKGGCSGGCLLY